ncbi:hypothetical protein AB0I99_11125 [Streptomyces spongiicola]|uniref:Uncharacterized protein n=1 Tax=Streptomyces spongiicola TaxID=1690221 RepID=A0ABM6VB45_9ACTN|nr:hypothetical protein [Streptomyces spongiicola]AWK11477.1 hypothetical protein DDQ41_24075 [Streptomyces spongiicola]
MLPADGGGGGAARDLERGAGALKRFQERVNALLAEFEEGEAGRSKLATQAVPRSSFSAPGAGFLEADGLHAQYDRVHSEIVRLSRSLGDQIEMLSIAVRGAEIGFDNLEENLRQRFHSIQTRVVEEQRAQELRTAQHRLDSAPDETGRVGQPRDDSKRSGDGDLG